MGVKFMGASAKLKELVQITFFVVFGALWAFGSLIGAIIEAASNNLVGVVLSIFIPGYGSIGTAASLVKWVF
jgi:hypothetical protein